MKGSQCAEHSGYANAIEQEVFVVATGLPHVETAEPGGFDVLALGLERRRVVEGDHLLSGGVVHVRL